VGAGCGAATAVAVAGTGKSKLGFLAFGRGGGMLNARKSRFFCGRWNPCPLTWPDRPSYELPLDSSCWALPSPRPPTIRSRRAPTKNSARRHA
jgi:hypothetical protein